MVDLRRPSTTSPLRANCSLTAKLLDRLMLLGHHENGDLRGAARAVLRYIDADRRRLDVRRFHEVYLEIARHRSHMVEGREWDPVLETSVVVYHGLLRQFRDDIKRAASCA